MFAAMFEYLDQYSLQWIEWLLVIACGILIGMSKTGLSGAGIMVVPILATIFGARPSTGFLLPMLVMADIFAVKYYNRHADWKYIIRLLPWTFAGILIALLVGESISDQVFARLMAITVFAGLALMAWKDIKGGKLNVPEGLWFSALVGMAGGFATMIGNAAGAILSVYLLSMALPKNSFIGTKAWFFMIVNLCKVPLHVFFWETISPVSFKFNLILLPAIATGALLGIFIVNKIPEKGYRILVMVMTSVSAIIMLIK